ncbi:MAG: energy-coupling factor transporter ATPase [Ruminococcaceae bacterium]|nr:energy-coupling factor transporter ATPase [Oscillospiraceae bacterium]
MAKLSIRDVTYHHSKGTSYEICALDHVSLDIEAGRVTGIIGHTGSGKSTLVEMLNGILRPESGQVLLDGKDIWEKPKSIRDVRFRVGLVMQYPEYQLFEETVRKDIAFGPRNMGLGEEEIAERVAEAAAFVGLEKELLDASPFDLSGGQKRRAAIAGVVAMRPEVLVLDEPAAGLDPQGRDAIFSNIVSYRQRTDNTVVIVSHSMEDMAKYCDDLIVLAGGKVVMAGTKEEVFSRADELTGVGLDIPQLTKMMVYLKQHGLAVDTGIYSPDAVLAELRKVWKKQVK